MALRRVTGVIGALVGAGALVLSGLGVGSANASPGSCGPVRLIIDTDIFTDVDDVGALAVANALYDQGVVQLLGVMVDTRSRWGAGAVDAINTYYGHGATPVGTLKPTDDEVATPNYAQPIADLFPHDLPDGARAPDAVALYRKLLADQPDHSVVIAAIGAETNLAHLLDSPPDMASGLSGQRLVAEKVSKLVMMGGRYPHGTEGNFARDAQSAVRVVNSWPTRVVFSGYEIGVSIMTGSKLTATPATNPVRQAYEIFAGSGGDRPSWDLTAVYVAGKGPGGVFSLSAPGRNTVGPDGANSWNNVSNGNQHYLLASLPSDRVGEPSGTVADRLNELMTQAPQDDET